MNKVIDALRREADCSNSDIAMMLRRIALDIETQYVIEMNAVEFSGMDESGRVGEKISP